LIVNEWKVQDDASNIIIFSKTGEVLFYKSGTMNDEDIQKATALIESNL
jgi:predicted transcriptional regulator